jgi:glycine/D-amino acid oxidase-like deaminating enzyme/nitrite reductase/ring-hydroxylating ferredoxin subunit
MPAPSPTRSPWMGYPLPDTAPLQSDASAEVCIVGAGIAGLTTAYLLGKKGKSVLVVDDGGVGAGMTSRTTAHLMTAIDDRYYEIERLHGAQRAQLAYQSHAAAVEAIEAIAQHENIECDLERLDGYLFLPPDGDPDELLREYEAALRAGVEGLHWVDRAPMDAFETGQCLCFPRQGQFHPLKYLAGLAHAVTRLGGRIQRGHVEEVNGGDTPTVRLSGGERIDCRSVVVATNVPISDRLALHTKQAPYLTYVVAARVPRGSVEKALFWDTLDPYHYVRLKDPDGEVLIVGGEDHKTGQADDSETRFARLELWMRERFPMAREVQHRWTGQVMEPADYLAYIGRDPGHGQENVYVATGDSGMGMTHGTIAGILITDLIHGADVPWAQLYDPSRLTLKAAKDLVRENANVAWQYTDWLKPGQVDSVEAVPEGGGAVMRRGIHKIAVYRDAAGTVHQMSARCTHLGCIVRWNHADHTWDCPCHGSRFDALGHVVSGPAVKSLEPVGVSAPAPVNPTVYRSDRPEGPPPGP